MVCCTMVLTGVYTGAERVLEGKRSPRRPIPKEQVVVVVVVVMMVVVVVVVDTGGAWKKRVVPFFRIRRYPS